MEQKREKFLKIYSNLPLNVREEIILMLEKPDIKNKLPITWNSAYFEIINRTKLSEEILKKLEEFKII
jgi:hypothetical protein